LGNRLRVLVSGKALATLSQRHFTMLWPRTPACGALFQELFRNKWNVAEATEEEVLRLPRAGGFSEAPVPDVFASGDPRIALWAGDWLVPTGPIIPPSPSERLLGSLRRSHWWNARLGKTGEPMAVATRLFLELDPVAEIREAAEAFAREHFTTRMIGVHLRRGDMQRVRPDATNNESPTLAQVDRWAARYPDARILLCTDDGALDPGTGKPSRALGVKKKFRERYGGRVVWTEPRSLDRNSVTAIQDAVVDLLLLRKTHFFTGAIHSSFAELAVLGREVDAVSSSGSILSTVWADIRRRLPRGSAY
jgi:hypothetical protein